MRVRLPIAVALLAAAGAVPAGLFLGPAEPPTPPASIDLDAVPPLDRSRATVPLDEIVFDLFNDGFVRLTDASPEVIRDLRDWIPPVYRPRYGGPEGLSWLRDDDLVVGYVVGDEAYAYPIKILNLREIVNDVIGGEPVVVTYCPLCGSGVVYSRRLQGRTLIFGNTSALYQSDLVMFDHETGSYWFQTAGEAIVGRLAGAELRVLPSQTAPWGMWRRLHPGTRLLVGDGPERFGARYARDPFAGYGEQLGGNRFPIPAEKLDHRLRPGEVVMTVEVRGARKAYPLRLLRGPINDVVGGVPVVVVPGAAGSFGVAFRAEAGGRRLTFAARDGGLRDRQTGSRWDAAGRAASGPLEGTRLEALPARRAFWFSVAIAEPGIGLYRP